MRLARSRAQGVLPRVRLTISQETVGFVASCVASGEPLNLSTPLFLNLGMEVLTVTSGIRDMQQLCCGPVRSPTRPRLHEGEVCAASLDISQVFCGQRTGTC